MTDRPEGPDRPTWRYEWPAGRRLESLLADFGPWTGLRVLDLGCGRGRLGLAAARLGASEVVLADGSAEAVATARANADAEGLTNIETLIHAWGDPLPGRRFDRIVGGDVLYRPDCFLPLLRSLAAALAEDGMAWLADPRRELDAELPLLAAQAELSWQANVVSPAIDLGLPAITLVKIVRH